MSGRPLRKIDDPLHWMWLSVSPHAISRLGHSAWPRASALHRAGILAFSYSRSSALILDVVAPSLLYVSVTTPSSECAPSVSVIHDSVKAGLGYCSSPRAAIM